MCRQIATVCTFLVHAKRRLNCPLERAGTHTHSRRPRQHKPLALPLSRDMGVDARVHGCVLSVFLSPRFPAGATSDSRNKKEKKSGTRQKENRMDPHFPSRSLFSPPLSDSHFPNPTPFSPSRNRGGGRERDKPKERTATNLLVHRGVHQRIPRHRHRGRNQQPSVVSTTTGRRRHC